ncbi:unnamed protein product [Lactuca saligna]|uniref:Uncharacterized protein n=1 Tax=Lactuca saligna TaxID=75948 RepID=A0AA36ED10_LACSI|nr:unnamed protein product [Lactuca saligna]
MQMDTGNADSPFEAEDHFDLPIRQLPPPIYGQPLGAHFEPQHEYHSYPQHNEPEPKFPLDIYSLLASLRLQGNRHTPVIRHIEEQQARVNNYMEDLRLYIVAFRMQSSLSSCIFVLSCLLISTGTIAPSHKY